MQYVFQVPVVEEEQINRSGIGFALKASRNNESTAVMVKKRPASVYFEAGFVLPIKGGHMLRSVMVLITATVVCALPVNSPAGDLDPPADPFHPDSAMHSIEQIFDQLDAGQYSEKRTGPFEEPHYGPGEEPVDESFHTLDDIMKIAPKEDNTDGATPDDVLAGKKYWGLRTDEKGAHWGPMTGEGDVSDLKAGNIKVGKTILGVAGTFNGTYCKGKLSDGGRWCKNGDGTVTDMTTGLTWLQKVSCSDINAEIWKDAVLWVIENVENGVCDLTDGSSLGDWRLPSLQELSYIKKLTEVEPVSLSDPGFFNIARNNVFDYSYWTKTPVGDGSNAYVVSFDGLGDYPQLMSNDFYFWPVRRQIVYNPAVVIPDN